MAYSDWETMLNPECTTTNVPISITSKPLLNSDCWMACIPRPQSPPFKSVMDKHKQNKRISYRKNRATDMIQRGVHIPKFRKICSFRGPISHACNDWVKFGMRQSTVARIFRAKFHPHRRNMREEKPHYRPMSSLNIAVCPGGGYPVIKIRGRIRARLIR